ncbi:MAG: hypothetical protein HYR85_16890 [Planctomycetes bacterium]|nr:hypothetical protein [Planctomycetota bacterium]MBI3847182.1 hypothetical protein [Planctomycetota bacterium]
MRNHGVAAIATLGTFIAIAAVGASPAQAIQIRLQPGQQRHIVLTVPRPLAFGFSMLDANGAPNPSDCAVYICLEDPTGLLVLAKRVELAQNLVFDLRPVMLMSATFRASTNGSFGALFDVEPIGPGPEVKEYNQNGTASDGTCIRRAAPQVGFDRLDCPRCYRYVVDNPGSCTIQILYTVVRRVGTGNQWTDNNPVQEANIAPGGSITIGPGRIRQISVSCFPDQPDTSPCKIRVTANPAAENECP